MALTIILICVIIILITANVHLYTRSIVARRLQETMEKSITAERKATASLIRLASEEVGTGDTEAPFLERYCDFTRRTMRVSGMAVFIREDDQYVGVAVSGIFPPLTDLPQAVRQQLQSHPKYHKEHIRKIALPASDPILQKATESKQALVYEGVFPSWIPASSLEDVQSLIIAPLVSRRQTVGMTIVVQDKDSPSLTDINANYVLRLSEIAGICIDGMRVSRERIEQENRLRRAQEEGMLQITTGMVHNIGNAITVAQLITTELLSIKKEREGPVLDFFLEEILPPIEEHQAKGDLGNFLQEDPLGQQYVQSISELLHHLKATRQEDLERLQALDAKLVHITEVIDLQQRFVGELGTEELLHIEEPLKNALTIVTESARKRGVTVHQEFGETPKVLADRTMLTQVYLNLLTNALQAFTEDSECPSVWVRTLEWEEDGKTYAATEITDNGCGIPEELHQRIFELGFTSKKDQGGGKGMGLHFCQETIKKYGGLLKVKSTPDQGSTFIVCLEP